jgi:hypothetical protein
VQKRSHTLLAKSLLNDRHGFDKRRFELAFLFGSFQPDCNPLSYLKGSVRGQTLRGHNFTNSQPYIDSRIGRLQNRRRWTVWQYYTLGKLTHYLADAFTFPHNETYPDGIAAHRRYERELRGQFARYLAGQGLRPQAPCADPCAAIEALHRRYLSCASDRYRDIRYILQATGLLMAAVAPQAA